MDGQQTPQQQPSPKAALTPGSTPCPLPWPSVLPLLPLWKQTVPPNHEHPHHILCITNRLQSCQQGRRKGHPFGSPAPSPLLWQPKAEQSPSLACSGKSAARADPGMLGGILGPATFPCPGCTANVTSWSVEEQELFSGFKRGNYFPARPSQASSTHRTIWPWATFKTCSLALSH